MVSAILNLQGQLYIPQDTNIGQQFNAEQEAALKGQRPEAQLTPLEVPMTMEHPGKLNAVQELVRQLLRSAGARPRGNGPPRGT